MRIDYSSPMVKRAIRNGMDGLLFDSLGVFIAAFKGDEAWHRDGTQSHNIKLKTLSFKQVRFKPISWENK